MFERLAALLADHLYERMRLRLRKDVQADLFGLMERVGPDRKPQTNPLAQALKDNANLRWNVKVLASALAEQLYATGVAGPTAPIPRDPQWSNLRSKLCCQADIESVWARYWCGQLQLVPLYRRGIWELCFALQAIWEAGLIIEGTRALGFGVGRDVLPAFLASRGVSVLATDMGGLVEESRLWRGLDGHAARVEDLVCPSHIDPALVASYCDFRAVDMTDIPADLHGGFDVCWSVCAFEHLGSIEAGLAFVENSLKCLKPGGIAVHTTEFSLDPSPETTDDWPTVLYHQRHFDELALRLARQGHELLPIDLDGGSGPLDRFIDHPPYAHDPHPALAYPMAPHLKLSVDGFPVTSAGLIIRTAAG